MVVKQAQIAISITLLIRLCVIATIHELLVEVGLDTELFKVHVLCLT